ncbi:hypothetical protein BB558_006960 [Smittium angustum]|uniref:Ras-GEF domain-containing protein n=1 Tax=Smittium angustum TaxID=133377 RepID=A0A2U1IWA7_SMIAN|nr:hypothetical protein BB558_006960 [Smittium angustum]
MNTPENTTNYATNPSHQTNNKVYPIKTSPSLNSQKPTPEFTSHRGGIQVKSTSYIYTSDKIRYTNTQIQQNNKNYDETGNLTNNITSDMNLDHEINRFSTNPKITSRAQEADPFNTYPPISKIDRISSNQDEITRLKAHVKKSQISDLDLTLNLKAKKRSMAFDKFISKNTDKYANNVTIEDLPEFSEAYQEILKVENKKNSSNFNNIDSQSRIDVKHDLEFTNESKVTEELSDSLEPKILNDDSLDTNKSNLDNIRNSIRAESSSLKKHGIFQRKKLTQLYSESMNPEYIVADLSNPSANVFESDPHQKQPLSIPNGNENSIKITTEKQNSADSVTSKLTFLSKTPNEQHSQQYMLGNGYKKTTSHILLKMAKSTTDTVTTIPQNGTIENDERYENGIPMSKSTTIDSQSTKISKPLYHGVKVSKSYSMNYPPNFNSNRTNYNDSTFAEREKKSKGVPKKVFVGSKVMSIDPAMFPRVQKSSSSGAVPDHRKESNDVRKKDMFSSSGPPKKSEEKKKRGKKITMALLSNEKFSEDSPFQHALNDIKARESSRSTKLVKTYLTKITLGNTSHPLELLRVSLDSYKSLALELKNIDGSRSLQNEKIPPEFDSVECLIAVISIDEKSSAEDMVAILSEFSKTNTSCFVTVISPTGEQVDIPQTEEKSSEEKDAQYYVKLIKNASKPYITACESSQANFAQAFPKLLARMSKIAISLRHDLEIADISPSVELQNSPFSVKSATIEQINATRSSTIIKSKDKSKTENRSRSQLVTSKSYGNLISQANKHLPSTPSFYKTSLASLSSTTVSQRNHMSASVPKKHLEENWLGYHLSGLWVNQSGQNKHSPSEKSKVFLKEDLLRMFIDQPAIDDENEFKNIFLLTYPRFLKPKKLWEYLVKWFNSYETNAALSTSIQIRIAHIILNWCKNYYREDIAKDRGIRNDILRFATNNRKIEHIQDVCSSIIDIVNHTPLNRYIEKKQRMVLHSKTFDLGSLSPKPSQLFTVKGAPVTGSEKMVDSGNNSGKGSPMGSLTPTGLENDQMLASMLYALNNLEIPTPGQTPSQISDFSFYLKKTSNYLIRRPMSGNLKATESTINNGNIYLFPGVDYTSFIDYKQMSKFLTGMEVAMFKNILPRDLLNYLWQPSRHKRSTIKVSANSATKLEVSDKDSFSSENLKASSESIDFTRNVGIDAKADDEDEKSSLLPSIDYTNFLSGWVIKSILILETPQLRSAMMEVLVKIATELYNMKNLNSLGAILSGINSAAVGRLSKTKSIFTQTRSAARLLKLETIMASEKSYSRYRATCREMNPNYIPFLPVLLGDLIHFDELSKDLITIQRQSPGADTNKSDSTGVVLEDNLDTDQKSTNSNDANSRVPVSSKKIKNKDEALSLLKSRTEKKSILEENSSKQDLKGINWYKFEAMGKIVMNFKLLQKNSTLQDLDKSLAQRFLAQSLMNSDEQYNRSLQIEPRISSMPSSSPGLTQ